MSCKCDTINIVNDNNVIVVSHADGRDGKSAYQQAVEGGYTGTEQEFNCSLSLLADVKQVKENLVASIEYKGGTSNADKSFQEIAQDIKEIPNFDQWARLAGVLAGNYANDSLTGYEQNLRANVTEIIDTQGFFKEIRSYTFQYWSLLEKVFMSEVQLTNGYPGINARFANCTALREARFPESTSWGVYDFSNTNNLETLEFGVLSVSTIENLSLYQGEKRKLRNFIVGANSDINLNLHEWTATNIINEGQSGIDELNSNLYNNLLTKLYDHSNDGKTRILRLGWLAYVTQENIDYANSNGWTLTT